MEGSKQYVVVTDVDMSFGNMVWFMVKWAFASIPAMSVSAVVGFGIMCLLAGVGVALGG